MLKGLLEHRLSLKLAERQLISDEINYLQEVIASMPHEPTQEEREEMFREVE